MEQLKLSIIQTELSWENREANLNSFSEKIDGIDEDSDLILLPEMFSTGFSMVPEPIADEPEGQTLSWMQSHAKAKDAAVSGSFIVKDKDSYYNRLYFVFPDGTFETYDKRHRFSFSGEHKRYSAGKEKLIVYYKDWKICPLICYDLRFPVWARNVEAYDLLFYIANWPQARIEQWDAMLKSRSIENLCYTVGVNRVGSDPNNNDYNGHSGAYDPLGKFMLDNQYNSDTILNFTLSKSHLKETRHKFRFLDDKDLFKIL